MAAPKLRNASWNAGIRRVSPYLEGFRSRLDDVSTDIRTVEKYLIETGFRIPVYLWWGEHGVAWAEIGESWRLCYASDLGNDRADLHPLIEVPVVSRLDAAEHFVDFLEELAKVAGVPPRSLTQDQTPSADDIPF